MQYCTTKWVFEAAVYMSVKGNTCIKHDHNVSDIPRQLFSLLMARQE